MTGKYGMWCGWWGETTVRGTDRNGCVGRRRTVWYYRVSVFNKINVHTSVFTGNIRYFRQVLMKFGLYRFSRNFIRIRPVRDELFHADGRMDEGTDGRTGGHAEANRRFSQFWIQHKNIFLEPLSFVTCK